MKCEICKKECDPNNVEPCEMPEVIAMNCVDNETKLPHHQEDYLKVIGVKR